MKHFVLDSGPDENGIVKIGGADYKYLVRVRRLVPGKCFHGVLPNGSTAKLRVLSVDGGTPPAGCLTCEVLPDEEKALSPGRQDLPPIILFQSIPKGEKMDLIIRQAAEGGIAGIVPFESEYSEVKIAGRGDQKFLRWQRIIKEARQQSGSLTATTVNQPLSFNALFSRWEEIRTQKPGAMGILFHQVPLADASLHWYIETNPETVVLAVGPEGGFSATEADRFLAAGFKPFTIGDTVLRTETAALYAQAAVRILLLEKDSWKTK